MDNPATGTNYHQKPQARKIQKLWTGPSSTPSRRHNRTRAKVRKAQRELRDKRDYDCKL